jgi:hypothetical protein
MKRLIFCTTFALVATALVLGATGMALAGHGATQGPTTKLWPTADSPFPNATGRVTTTLEGPYYDPYYGPYYVMACNLEVYGLAPDTVYLLTPYNPQYSSLLFVTDGNGDYRSGPVAFAFTTQKKLTVPDYQVGDQTIGIAVLDSRRY